MFYSYRLEDWILIHWRDGDFSVHHPCPLSLLFDGYWKRVGSLTLGIKGSEHKANHSPPTIAEDKKAWSFTSNHTPSWYDN
jgi:hypothetical protein